MENNITEVVEDDLNLVDKMNGVGSIASKGTVFSNAGRLKGALDSYGGSFSKEDELIFLRSQEQKIYEYKTEQFNYLNLPKGLDKYRIETKILNNGYVGIIKHGDSFLAVNYTIKDFNIYNEPETVIINEPKSKLFNGKKYKFTDKTIGMIRDNIYGTSIFRRAYRLMSAMEKILFQIEKNITRSAPKGILNLKNNSIEFSEPKDDTTKGSMENIINGQDTFYTLRSQSDYDMKNDNDEELFIPIELTDMSASLITQYSFFKEELKELIGAEMNIVQKKERLVTDEVNKQQGVTNATRQHALNVRERDIKVINEIFNLNIELEVQADEIEEPEENGEENE